MGALVRLALSRAGRPRSDVAVEALPFTIGSSPDADLVLEGVGVQAIHGTVVAGTEGIPEYRPARGRRGIALGPGAGFRVGPFELKVRAEPATATVAPGDRPLAALLDALPGLCDASEPTAALLHALREGFGASWGVLLEPEETGGWRVICRSGSRAEDEGDRVSRTVLAEVEATGKPVVAEDVQEHPALAAARSLPAEVRSVIAARLEIPGGPPGYVYLESPKVRRAYTSGEGLLLDRVGALAADHLRRAREARALAAEAGRLRELFQRDREVPELVGESEAMRLLRAEIARAAATDVTVLVLGETGTGKELVARLLHAGSTRSGEPFVAVNCAAIPSQLAESELFGHEAGAFSGAAATRLGRFELADRGTLFLDELGDLPGELQPKLLRVLEDRAVLRLGGTAPRGIDVRLVAATHQDLDAKVARGEFREDLFYRLSVFVLRVPPLRERLEDVPALAESFVAAFNAREGRGLAGLEEDAAAALARYRWPGNVRELRNVIEMACVRATGTRLAREDLLFAPALHPVDEPERYEDARRSFDLRHFRRVLRSVGGDTKEAATRLGLSRSQVYRKCEELGLDLRTIRD